MKGTIFAARDEAQDGEEDAGVEDEVFAAGGRRVR